MFSAVNHTLISNIDEKSCVKIEPHRAKMKERENYDQVKRKMMEKISANICKMTYVLNIFDLNWVMFFTRCVNQFFSFHVLGSLILLVLFLFIVCVRVCIDANVDAVIVVVFVFLVFRVVVVVGCASLALSLQLFYIFCVLFLTIDSCFNFTMPISN